MCDFFIYQPTFRRPCRFLQAFYNYKNIINIKLQEYIIISEQTCINILPTNDYIFLNNTVNFRTDTQNLSAIYSFSNVIVNIK